MYDTIKIIDLNPVVTEDQIYDLLCEKFSKFPNTNINVVQQEDGRVAYIHFRNQKDAAAAMQQNSRMVLFGYACRSVPIYGKPGTKRSADDNRYQTVDEYSSDLLRYTDFTAGGHERASLSPDKSDLVNRPQRPSDGYHGRGRRGARWGASHRFHRGFGSARGRSRGSKPNEFTSPQARGAKRPYLLTKSGDSAERKSEMLLAGGSDNGQKEYKSTPQSSFDDVAENAPNSTLYVGSMDPLVKEVDLTRLFNSFGYVLSVEIKKPSAAVCFAFVHFLTVDMAQLAKQEMEGKPIGRTVPRLGYGKTVESKCLWVGGLGKWTTEDMLRYEFGQFGEVEKVNWPKNRDYAFVLFTQVQDAIDAKQVMHGTHHGDPPHCIRIYYASAVQMTSYYNKKDEFPKFPRERIVSRRKTYYKEKRKSRDWEPQEFHRRQRPSPEQSRSHSHRRKSHSLVRPRKKPRKSLSPYARSISQASSDNDRMSAISEPESVGSPERVRQRKRHRKLSVSRSPPVSKLLRNPSPPKSVKKDERTVVLRSEPQSSVATSCVFTSVSNPVYSATVPYASSVDAVMYYPSVASTLPPSMFPPPVHLPPPDYYMQANPMMPPYQQHLQPLASYPPVATDNTQSVPVVGHSNVLPVETSNIYVADKPRQDTTPVKKSATVSFATQFPKVWSGALVLRNAAFVVDFHLLSGSVMLVNSLLGNNVEPGSEADCPVLKIAQRLRLDQPDKLDELDRRLKKAGRSLCSVLLATSTPAQVDDDANVVQQYPLSSLVSYLLQKQVAAVVSLPPGTMDVAKATGVLHAFPPSKFATDFLQKEAPELPTNCPTEEELLVVLCKF